MVTELGEQKGPRADDPAVRLQLLQPGWRVVSPVPDALLAVIFMLAALPFFADRHELVFGLIAEGGFLMMQGTLVDIATRLKKRPPVWAIAIIVIGVALFSREAMDVLRAAWSRGMVVFIPLLFSLGERATVLWRLPTRPRIEKIAARALISNRITTGLVLFALLTLSMVIGVIFLDAFDALNSPSVFFGAGALYFAVAAFDDWRVRGRKFAENPTVLFRFDPLGITYLESL